MSHNVHGAFLSRASNQVMVHMAYVSSTQPSFYNNGENAAMPVAINSIRALLHDGLLGLRIMPHIWSFEEKSSSTIAVVESHT